MQHFAAFGKVKGRGLVHAAQDGNDGRFFARQHLACFHQPFGKVGGFGFFTRGFFGGERFFAFFQFGLARGQRLFALCQFGFFGFKFGFVHRVLRLRGFGGRFIKVVGGRWVACVGKVRQPLDRRRLRAEKADVAQIGAVGGRVGRVPGRIKGGGALLKTASLQEAGKTLIHLAEVGIEDAVGVVVVERLHPSVGGGVVGRMADNGGSFVQGGLVACGNGTQIVRGGVQDVAVAVGVLAGAEDSDVVHAAIVRARGGGDD